MDVSLALHNPALSRFKDLQNDKIQSDANVASYVTIQTASAQNELAAVSLSHSLGATLNSYVVNTAATLLSLGASNGNNVIGGLASQVASGGSALANMNAASANTMASIGTNTQIAQMAADANAAYAYNAKECNRLTLERVQLENALTTQKNNDSATTQTNRNANTNNANAVASQNTTDANAARTQTTETNNATYDRNASVTAAKADLVQKQLEVENQYKNARLHAPVKYSDYSGTFSQDALKRRGVRFNIRTQSKSVIAQTGDAMLRFGYALHRVWDMKNGFHYGKHFTFWKAEDIWINDGNGVANTATNTIGQILMKGVTVWKNPDEIGMIGIYDNI